MTPRRSRKPPPLAKPVDAVPQGGLATLRHEAARTQLVADLARAATGLTPHPEGTHRRGRRFQDERVE
ncbi:MAG: hypothetical protein WBG81_03795 [Rhodanobacter sp.]|uniref:hypothetical protein n=1 Tax=Rhodanobacter sp. KK11 TaxID=3083255 RepID=UPI0029671DF4|nr:hypothetical protein [Rhodanobacter sp. KK11]MDW2981845.1 hypothetical protein [Rhodanobacter sp. KK11]